MKDTGDSDVFSKLKYWHENIVASFTYALIDKSIMYITTHKQKAPIYKISRSENTKNTASCGLQT